MPTYLGWMIYEATDSTKLDPYYRMYTGTFETKEAALEAQLKIKAKYGWVTYLIDETKYYKLSPAHSSVALRNFVEVHHRKIQINFLITR